MKYFHETVSESSCVFSVFTGQSDTRERTEKVGHQTS